MIHCPAIWRQAVLPAAAVWRVDLIRMDREGRTTVKQLRYDPMQLNSANNPPLQNGDVVVVDRNNAPR